jgi:hypothetical protein
LQAGPSRDGVHEDPSLRRLRTIRPALVQGVENDDRKSQP